MGLSGMRDDAFIQVNEDVGLMVQAQKGDRQAYARLYEKYVPVVRRYMAGHNRRADSPEDLVQEVFTRVWCRRSEYQPLAPVRSYLLGVAANVLHESCARAHNPVPADIHGLETAVDVSQPSPPSQAQSTEQLQAVHAMMASLSARQRQAVELVYLVGLPPSEAARRLGCSLQTVCSHLCSAREKLRKLAQLSQKK
jgi:RNA polymerase sigma-70 factor (ECF subfamily)